MNDTLFPFRHQLLRRARQASDRLWSGRRDDGAAQVIDALVDEVEELADVLHAVLDGDLSADEAREAISRA